MTTHKVGDPIWTALRIGDIGFITHVFPYSGVVYAKFMRDETRIVRLTFDEARPALSYNGIIPMDQHEASSRGFLDERLDVPMCKEPMNPKLPHWRKKDDQSITATPLTGDNLKAAQRAQAVADAARRGEREVAHTAQEFGDWGIYSAYYDQVSNELVFNKHPEIVTAYDVSEEVRKRLAKAPDEATV
jgi:hypothetical protein